MSKYDRDMINIISWDDDELQLIGEITLEGKTITVPLEPEYSEMSSEELNEYISRAEDVLHLLHHEEPDDDESEEHELWEEKMTKIEELLNAAETALGEK